MKRYFQYVKDVKNKKIFACKNLIKAIERFGKDIAESKAGTSRWIFDEDAADNVIDFMECLVQWEEPFTGQTIELQPWQCFFLGQLYGWRDRETGLRRFKKAVLFVAKKQGKTTLVSGLVLYEMLTKAGIQAYSLATKYDIASITLNNIKAFIEEDDELVERFTVFAYDVINKENRSKFTALSSDKKVDGKNAAFIVVDELSSHDNADAFHALMSGMGTRSERLAVIITTAGYGLDNPMIEEYAYACDILAGIINDDSYLAAIYEFDKGDKWDNMKNLQKSCPSLGVTVNKEYYEDQVTQAQRIPSLAGEYKVKYCNFWEEKVETWIADKVWMKCAKPPAAFGVTPEELVASPCIIALDFSTIWDWTAATRYHYIERIDKYFAFHRFYIPEDQIDTKAHLENASIKDWIQRGFVVATPGESIDYSYLFSDLDKDLLNFRVEAITYDPAKAKEFEMTYQHRATIVPFLQRSTNMSPAAKAWEKGIVDEVIIDESPVMRWMVSNAINRAHPDSGAYFITKNKKSGRKRIDGVITSLMAYAVLREIVATLKNRPKIFDLSKISY